LDHGRHQSGDRRPERRDLLDEARGDVGIALVGHHEHRLHALAQLAVHQRHLELVLEIGHRAEAAHDAVGLLALDQVDDEPVERGDAQAVHSRRALVDQLEPLLDAEQRLLRGVRADGDDQLVEDAQAALDEVQVAVVDGVEHAGIHRALAHENPPLDGRWRLETRPVYAGARKKVKVVSPNFRAFQRRRSPTASGGGAFVPCCTTTTAPGASASPAPSAASAGTARGESEGGSRNPTAKRAPRRPHSPAARGASARTTRARAPRPSRSMLSRSARSAAASCSTNTADGAPRESASMPTLPPPAKRSRKGPLARNGINVSRHAIRTRSAVGRVADPRGVWSRCPFSSPASTLTPGPGPPQPTLA